MAIWRFQVVKMVSLSIVMAVVSACVNKMKIKNKENNSFGITSNFDKKSYELFKKEIIELAKKYEDNSKVKNLKYSVFINGMRDLHMEVKGWCSRIIDDNGKVSEILMLDYDEVYYDHAKAEMLYLIEKYDLPPFIILTSEEKFDEINKLNYGNYMALCLKKNTLREVFNMQSETHADRNHMLIPLKNRYATTVLRLGPKGKKSAPKFKEIIGDTNKEYPQEVSEAHWKGLKQLYPEIPDIKFTNLDGNNTTKLWLNVYKTASK